VFVGGFMLDFNKKLYIGILVLSAAFLFFGNMVASRGWDGFLEADEQVFSAVVTEVTDIIEDVQEFGHGIYIRNTIIAFSARITSGERRGMMVSTTHIVPDFIEVIERDIESGDRIILMYNDHFGEFFFAGHARINYIAILGALFFLAIILLGGKKGFNSIIALGFTCMAIFLVFIPAILSGMNIYTTTAVIATYSILTTLLIVVGVNKKALSAILGCLGGVLLAGLLMYSMDVIMQLTGLVDQEARMLLNLPTGHVIDLRAIIFAGVVIGSAGAIMDVAMSLASSLWEVRQAGGVADFRSIFKSGIEIGKDILGTMLNTLILAYIGSSLSLILLIVAYTTSTIELLNSEMIIVEFLRALVGSFGMLLTVPLTAAICAWLYPEEPPLEESEFWES